MSTVKRDLIQSNSQPKKLIIKNLKAAPKLPSNFEETTWQKLQEAIRAIQNNSKTSLSLEELYKASEDMCLHKMAPNLYNNMKSECELHIQKQSQTLLNQTSQPFEYLTLVNNCWHEHCKHMIDIRSVLLYLDRTYVLQNSSIQSIWDLGLTLFREYVISHEEIKRKVVYSFLSLIQREREGDAVDRTLMKSISRMFSSLQIYNELLEKPFLDASDKFYQSEGNIKSRELESADYLKHIDNRLVEESDRVLYYLESTTKRSIISIVEKHLISNHLDYILSGFNQLAKNLRKEDIKRMYSLISRISQLERLKDTWKSYIKDTGLEMIKLDNPEKEKTLVQDLLDFKSQLDSLLEDAFHKSDIFTYALKEAFESFINSRANKPAELIAKYVDSKLKIGKISEEELEIVLDKVLVLFRFIHGKDIFEAFYKKDLAKRLLLQKSSSFDAEKLMISKLKAECGASFTNKLEGMFKDIDVSKDVMSHFKQSPFYNQVSGDLDLYVYVLTAGYWPAYPYIEVTLPKQMTEYQEVFKKFYFGKHTGRKLTFQNSLGYCTLRANFKAGKKELIVSVFQTVVLEAFNSNDSLSYSDLKATTNLEDKELKRVLYSLIKVKLLIKATKTKDISEEDVFNYNKDFKFKLYRIKVNNIQMKETVEENLKTTQTVMQDRQYQIDAAIVRIMKTRKSLSHTKLVNEVLGQLKFDIRGADIKKRIESLIEREYLERDTTDAQTYMYVA